jgi:hypothetical protein
LKRLMPVLSLIAISLGLFGCGTGEGSAGAGASPGNPPTATRSDAPPPAPATLPMAPDRMETPADDVLYGYTYHRADGNRLVAGSGSLPGAAPVDVPLDGVPRWVVGVPVEGGSLWAVALADGRVQGFLARDGVVEDAAITPEALPPDTPPLLRVATDGTAALVTPPVESASPLTHPVALADGRIAFVDGNGDLVFWGGGEAARLAVDALPDARILRDERDRLLLLTGPTTRYAHGALADEIEAAAVTLVETAPEPRIAGVIPATGGAVIEGIAPIWADVTGDGAREIVVTLSDAERGARLAVFDEAGAEVAVGPAVGQGFRWRHQIAAAPFGPSGEIELADVLTPHIGGVVEFFRLDGGELALAAGLPGYTSHVIRTRNLDLALAGDFDGDGAVELLVLNPARTELAAIARTDGGASEAWTLPLGGELATNLAAVETQDGGIALAAGRADRVLRLWLD